MNYPFKKVDDPVFGKGFLIFPLPKGEHGERLWFAYMRCYGLRINLMLNANRKGKAFEREIAKYLNREFGANVRRTPGSGSMSFKGDILDTKGILSEWHFECKKQESLNVWKAIQQAKETARQERLGSWYSAGTTKIRIVFYLWKRGRICY